jgi:hypothetical protein
MNVCVQRATSRRLVALRLYGTTLAATPHMRQHKNPRPTEAAMKKPACAGFLRSVISDCRQLSQIAAEALDTLAGIFEIGRLGRIGNPESRSQSKGRALHDGNAFALQQLGDEVFVIADQLARRRGLADGAGA